MNEQRERFEAWAVKQYDLHGSPWLVNRVSSGEYLDLEVRGAWMAWQTACPDDWQCVPKEPTYVMSARGMEAMPDHRYGMPVADRIYQAMLAAAPKPGEL